MHKFRTNPAGPLPGYLYVYLSYEGSGTNWVYFDDFKVTHTQTNVLQYNEYYPFGLTTSSSWTREAALGNNYLYNEGSELNLTTEWYEMPFRNYDPVLRRLTSLDPLATAYASISPYHHAANNPVSKNDPTGANTVGGCNCPDQTDMSAQEYSKCYAREQMRHAGIDPVIQDYYLFNQSQNGQKQNTKVFMYSEVSGQIAYVNGEEVSRSERTKYWFEIEHTFSKEEEAQQKTPVDPHTILPWIALRMMLNLPDAISFGGQLEAVVPAGEGHNRKRSTICFQW